MAQADYSEIVLAQRRDEECVHKLSSKLSELARILFGQRDSAQWHHLMPALSALLYLAGTNGFNLQTLGEEYVGLLQVDSSQRRSPSFWQRWLFITLNGPLISLLNLENRLLLLAKNWPHFSTLLDALKNANPGRLVQAVFLLVGSSNYSLGKSLAGISYLSIRPQHNIFPPKVRLLIGLSVLIQFFTIFAWNLVENTRLVRQKTTQNGMIRKRFRECKICSSTRQHVAMPCGHIFCAECLPDSVQKQSLVRAEVKCAYCRSIYPRNAIVPLLNF